MATLKSDLDDYLIQNDSRRGFKLSMPKFSKPSWFSKSEDESPSTSNGWFSDNQKESCLPSLTRTQRMIGFATCMGLGLLCFILSMIYIPVLLFKARKFALLYTLGSCFFIFSFSFLYGPWNHVKQMFSKERVVRTLVYTFALVGTLYSALHLQSTIATIIFAILQIFALAWIALGAMPGGAAGMKFFGSMFKSSVSNTLPI